MGQPGLWLGWLSKGLLACSLLAISGCLGFLHPIDPGQLTEAEPCQALPRSCRDHVYVFLMNGLDPVNYGNLTGLRDYLNGLGISHTYYGQIYHVWWFESEIRRIHEEDAEARFVLIGFSLGSNLVNTVARSVQADGVPIELMVFLSGNHPVQPMPRDRPENVHRVLNILASGIMASRGERDWAENLRVPAGLHFDTPTHPVTLTALAREMATIGAMVPITEPLPPPLPPPTGEEAPTPRPVKVRTSAKRGEWDFLKPAMHLSQFPEEEHGPSAQPALALKPRPAPGNNESH